MPTNAPLPPTHPPYAAPWEPDAVWVIEGDPSGVGIPLALRGRHYVRLLDLCPCVHVETGFLAGRRCLVAGSMCLACGTWGCATTPWTAPSTPEALTAVVCAGSIPAADYGRFLRRDRILAALSAGAP